MDAGEELSPKSARPDAVDPVNAMQQVLSALSAGRPVEEKPELALKATQILLMRIADNAAGYLMQKGKWTTSTRARLA